MMYGVVVFPWVIILALVWVLLAGQPAGQQMQLDQIASQSTQIALYKAAQPTPTPCRMNYGTAWRGC